MVQNQTLDEGKGRGLKIYRNSEPKKIAQTTAEIFNMFRFSKSYD